MEAIDEELATISVKGACNPEGDRNADGEVGEVSANDLVHRVTDLICLGSVTTEMTDVGVGCQRSNAGVAPSAHQRRKSPSNLSCY